MTENETQLRCDVHDVALVHRNWGDTVKGLKCPVETDSVLSTSNRFCTSCGARDASWMSGTCDSCYRKLVAEEKASQREYRANSSVREGIHVAIEAATDTGREDVAAWLRQYKETLP